jgi:DNA replication protein DnaC
MKTQSNPSVQAATQPVKHPAKNATQPSLTNHRDKILQHLEDLKLKMPHDAIDQIVRESTEKSYGVWEILERFLAVPSGLKREQAIASRIRRACFPSEATLESYDWSFNLSAGRQAQVMELATGEFVRRSENVTFVGKSGLGKTHIIEGLGKRCCVAGYRVLYTKSAQLIELLNKARAIKSLPQQVRKLRAFDWLIIDEFGFDKLERREISDALSLLYKVIDARVGRSTAVVTNVDFKDWTDYLGDPQIVMAMLDRLVYRSQIVKFDGKSYRAASRPQGAK